MSLAVEELFGFWLDKITNFFGKKSEIFLDYQFTLVSESFLLVILPQ